jgi:hypothetical protein
MAVININLTDDFSRFINRTNDISAAVGDVSTLTTGDSSVVAALNTIQTVLASFDDSAEIQNIAKKAISVVDNGGDGGLSYDEANGEIIYNGPTATEVRAHFSAGSGLTYDEDGVYRIGANAIVNSMIADNTITSDRFSNRVTFEIKNSSGNVVKTIYSPGS